MDRQKINDYNEKAAYEWKYRVLEKCPVCGRAFLPDRIFSHMKSCKKEGIFLNSEYKKEI